MPRKKISTSNLPAKSQPEGLAGVQGKDFSGLDFVDISVDGQNFFESIFNGCEFRDVRATQSIFQHTEFTEASLSNCVFEDTSFDHSDFVLTTISGSEFVRCSFQNAEWRDATFEDVSFRQCIFRNTTTSLAHFTRCSFDDASASSFIGRSKRFSIFSGTKFRLPYQHIDFLRTNFGIRSQEPFSAARFGAQDPLFSLSLLFYAGELRSEGLYHLILDRLSEIASNSASAHRLTLRYISDICRVCVQENLLSVFAIQLLDEELSRVAALMRRQEQALELISLILTLRVALRERISNVEEEVSSFSDLPPSRLRLQMEFENTYDRESIDEYANQMATYCRLSRDKVVLESVREGSTIAELFVAASAFVPDVFRFIKYSLSFATISLVQARKLREAYTHLASDSPKPRKAATQIARSKSRSAKKREQPSGIVTNEIIGARSDDTKPIEIFVDAVRERVLVVDGRVRVTISMV